MDLELIWYFFYIISFLLLLDLIFYYFTKFEKIVIIKSKYLRKKGKRDQYMMSDVENNIYHVKNRILSLEFNEAEDWNLITIGKTYKISGYGTRIPFLGIYPIIIDIIPVE